VESHLSFGEPAASWNNLKEINSRDDNKKKVERIPSMELEKLKCKLYAMRPGQRRLNMIT
jgi:hypothetical protein